MINLPSLPTATMNIQPRRLLASRFRLAAAFLILTPSLPAQAQEKPASEIPQRIQQLLQADEPGVAVLAKRGDEILLDYAHGLANLSHQVPATPQTKFRIGSVTKHITSTAILKLQEEGKLSIDDHLDRFFPNFPRASEVTIAQLMNHTSGIFSYTDAPEFFNGVTNPITPEDLVKSFQDKPYKFDPGTSWSYNNSAYFLLGEIVAKASGQSFADYLQSTFFKPLKLDNTGIHQGQVVYAHEADGYSFVDGKFLKALNWDMSHAGGAGAIYSTTHDLAGWVDALFAHKIINAESLQQALTPVVLPENVPDPHYGFGWSIDTHRGLKRYSHGGGLQGFSSFLAYYPEHQFTVVVLHNALPAKPPMDTSALASKIAETLLAEHLAPLPTYTVDESVDAETQKKYVGKYDYVSATMVVTFEDNQLYAQLTGQPKHPIYPMSSTKFFWKVVDAQVEFVVDENGVVTGGKHSQGPANFFAARLPDREIIELSDETLDRYVGTYQLPLLGTYTIKRQGKHLVAQVKGQPAIEIYAYAETDFLYEIIPATVHFSNINDGQAGKVELKQAGQVFSGDRLTEKE